MTNTLSLILRKYRWRYVGHLAFWVQRVTGVALLGYLLVHVHTIRDLKNPETFGDALRTFGSPLFKLGEIALLATVILHALNGIRLTLVDLGVGLTRQRQMFWYFAMGVGLVLFLAGAVPMFIFGILNH
jgi:succinate dehydrogenase cytochrome b subunit